MSEREIPPDATTAAAAGAGQSDRVAGPAEPSGGVVVDAHAEGSRDVFCDRWIGWPD
jgi:hypothetical protein